MAKIEVTDVLLSWEVDGYYSRQEKWNALEFARDINHALSGVANADAALVHVEYESDYDGDGTLTVTLEMPPRLETDEEEAARMVAHQESLARMRAEAEERERRMF